MLFHYTHPTNKETILEEGLHAGRKAGAGDGIDWVRAFYDEDPVFLTTEGSAFIAAYLDQEWSDYVCFEVEERGLPLAADLASLVDMGARYREGMLCVARREALEPLLEFADENGWIEIEHLVDPETDAARAAIRVTGTAACLGPIHPHRIALRESAPAP
jgi:hypothetical protein